MSDHIGNALLHILRKVKDDTEDQLKPIAEREGIARIVLQFGIDRMENPNHQAEALAAYDAVQHLCESPIERVTLAGLLTHRWGRPEQPPAVHDPTKDDMLRPAPDGLTIVPQARFLRHRLDFALVAEWGGTQHIVGIECDGEDFHKGIADRERDLYLASWGIPCFRLRGKAITSNIHDALAPISAALLSWRLEKLADLRGVAADMGRERLGRL